MTGVSFLIIQAKRMKDVFGQALLDYQHKTMESPLLLHTEYGPPEPVPLERFFAGEDEFPDLDIFASCGVVMKEAGVEKIIIEDVFDFNGQIFDAIFMLMNGIGIARTIEGLKKLLRHLKQMMKPTGQLFLDSSELSYLYENSPLTKNTYFGELSYWYQYKDTLGDPFNWLFIDRKKLVGIANSVAWDCQIIYEDETGAYLARLQMM